MKRPIEKVVTVLLMSVLLFSALQMVRPVAASPANDLKFIPGLVEIGVGHVDETPVNISVACVIEDAQELYGLDVQISWDTEYLRYVDHFYTMPVEDYPDPISPSPYNGTFYEGPEGGINVIKDKVDESGGISGADPDAMYWLSALEKGMCPEYFGSTTIFVMNFTVLKQPWDTEYPDYLDTLIHFESVDLANSDIPPIHLDYTTEDGTVRLWSIQTVDSIRPSIGTPSQIPPAANVMPDQEVTVSVNVTDAESGVKNVSLSYRINDNAVWSDLQMIYNEGLGLYEATIPGQPNGTSVSYKIIAYDNADNVAIDDNEGEFYVYEVIHPSIAVHATVKVTPPTLNLKTTGKWIVCYIQLPEGYDISEVDISTIRLNDTIPVDPDARTAIRDNDNDTVLDLMVKFNRTRVSEYVLGQNVTYGNITLTLTGEFYKITSFKGSTIIRVSSLICDADCDGKVDLYDLVEASVSYGVREGEPSWNPNADWAPPYGTIDLYDIVTCAYHYGETA